MVRIFPDHESLSRSAAEHVLLVGPSAIEARGRFDLVLSGGGTPRRTYEILAERTLADREFWQETHLYWGDERCVPTDDRDSNYLMARRALLGPARVPAGNIHPIDASASDAQAAAERYDRVFPASPDLLILGMGVEGHTASLFPGSAALDERERRFTVVLAPVEPARRITMTPAAIAAARNVMVLVSGAEKAAALQRVFAEEGDIHDTPARLVRDASWFVDETAHAPV